MDDLISRQTMLEGLASIAKGKAKSDAQKSLMGRVMFFTEQLPSAQPEHTGTHSCDYQRAETHGWIPVSEALPEEKQDVLLAFKHNMVVGFWEDILNDGGQAWYANSGNGWFTGTEAVDDDGFPLAWMPLPEPYKEEQDD